jgi:hypothetical protein
VLELDGGGRPAGRLAGDRAGQVEGGGRLADAARIADEGHGLGRQGLDRAHGGQGAGLPVAGVGGEVSRAADGGAAALEHLAQAVAAEAVGLGQRGVVDDDQVDAFHPAIDAAGGEGLESIQGCAHLAEGSQGRRVDGGDQCAKANFLFTSEG